MGFFAVLAEFPKLNYGAICNVFDVVNIRPYWKIYKLRGKSDQGCSAAQNTELEFANGLPFAQKKNCLDQSPKASSSASIIPLWIVNLMTIKEKNRDADVVTSKKGTGHCGRKAMGVIDVLMRGYNAHIHLWLHVCLSPLALSVMS